ncbi:protein OXIDATIVE STRESS 3 LIKE 4-like [Alnus glutinosa]|uniref:protein OXIDATIVE STRESS 3 LIKE 4-like n=1 Tax=Alnus glutinosa TaxID=3517 RepID=UPI002D79ECE2|nr:protein OXIDATIVE STRESS 3 LIKE 4-like [Alnus glutinosa]
MEVLVGPVFGIEVRDRSGVAVVPNDTDQRRVATCLFLKDDDVGVPGKALEQDDDLSESSSSIGAPDDSEDEDNDDVSSKEVRSGFNGGGFAFLGSLEDSLPIKRGLSNHFTGKSKSFANLSEVSTVKDLEKSENSFNKRRRILVASKLSSRRSSFYSSFNPKSMPLLALKEDEDEDEQHQDRQGYPSSSSSSSPSSSSSSSSEKKERQEEDRDNPERLVKKLLDRRFLSLKSRSCFSLSDLQEHDEQEDDNDDDDD